MTQEQAANTRGLRFDQLGRRIPEKFLARRWKPGCPSPNPAGRPRRRAVIDLIEDRLREVAKIQGIPDPGMILADVLLRLAVERKDLKALKEILDRRDGPVTQRIEQNIGVQAILRERFEELMRPAEDVEIEMLPPEQNPQADASGPHDDATTMRHAR